MKDNEAAFQRRFLDFGALLVVLARIYSLPESLDKMVRLLALDLVSDSESEVTMIAASQKRIDLDAIESSLFLELRSGCCGEWMISSLLTRLDELANFLDNNRPSKRVGALRGRSFVEEGVILRII
jgi:hypothetical protein